MDKIFESYLKELITGRTEELAWAAEKLPEFKAEMKQLKDLRDELITLIGEERAGELITTAVAQMCLFTNTAIALDWRTAFV